MYRHRRARAGGDWCRAPIHPIHPRRQEGPDPPLGSSSRRPAGPRRGPLPPRPCLRHHHRHGPGEAHVRHQLRNPPGPHRAGTARAKQSPPSPFRHCGRGQILAVSESPRAVAELIRSMFPSPLPPRGAQNTGGFALPRAAGPETDTEVPWTIRGRAGRLRKRVSVAPTGRLVEGLAEGSRAVTR
eukprot:scaffold1414_cov384-Prasinococcus_capsulatus_cf.AAC.16